MEVERYSHVLHLVSHVEAKLRPELDALDALRSVFPAGTLSGAPKVRAMQLISAAEGERRGLYGGAVGYLGYDGNLDTAITIRSAVLRDGQAHIHTGAGIVAGSVPESEFDETEHKAAALRRAIELASATGAASANGRGDAARRRGDDASAAAPDGGRRRVILVVDNYDSFTFNLVQALEAAGRGGAASSGTTRWIATGLEALAADERPDLRGIVVSPGPSDPAHAGVSVDAVKVAAERRIPLLGVCLGMQSMAAAFGAAVVRAPDARPRRGVGGHARRRRAARRACRPSFMAARYHSLCVDPATLPPEHHRDRDQRGRPGGDGHPPLGAAAGGRAVPPGVGAHAAGPAPPRELPPARRRGRGARLDAVSGSFATRGMAETGRRRRRAATPRAGRRPPDPPSRAAGAVR